MSKRISLFREANSDGQWSPWEFTDKEMTPHEYRQIKSLRQTAAYIKEMQAEIDRLKPALAVIEQLLASASPHPYEQPSMFDAWRNAQAFLARGG